MTIARILGRPRSGRAPLAIAAFLAIPLFFCSLMASTLAQERAVKIQWHGCKSGVCTVWHDPSGGTEARIWLWALVPSLVLVIAGWVAMRLPLGFYVSCVASIALALAVAHKTATWAYHHTLRFPFGPDLIPRRNHISDIYFRGEWEKEALSTALSLEHWTVGVAIASILAMSALWLRGRRRARRPRIRGVPSESIHAPDATTPGL